MFKEWLRQAWKNSKEYWILYLLVPLLFAIIALPIRFLTLAEELRMGEVISWVIWTVIPAVIGGMVVFAWHFVRAPYQILRRELTDERGRSGRLQERVNDVSHLVSDEAAKNINPQKYVFPHIRGVNASPAILSGENYILVNVSFTSALGWELEVSLTGQLSVNHHPVELKLKRVTMVSYATQQAQWQVELTKQAKDSIMKSYSESLPISVSAKFDDTNNKKLHWETTEETMHMLTKVS